MEFTNLMLELGGVTCMYRHCCAVNVQLANDGTASLQLCSVRLFGALAQPQKADEYVLFGVLVRKECLPSAVCDIVTPNEFRFVRLYFVVDLLDAHFARAHVATLSAQITHARQSELAQVAMLDT